MRDWTKLVCVFWAFGCGNAADPNATEPGSSGAGSGGTSGGAGSSAAGASAGGNSSAGSTSAGTGGALATGGTSPGSGGSSGSSGASGGSSEGGAGTHVVEACPTSEMGGPGVVNVVENITPSQITISDSGAGSIASAVVDPLDTRNVYAGTDSMGLFRSSDCGATWTKISTGQNASKLESGIMWNLAIDPVNSQVLYTGALYGEDLGLFKSTNGGVDWETIFPTPEIAPTINFTGVVAVDPTDHEHLLLTLHDVCKGDLNWGCMAESKDSGSTWKLIKVPPASWSHNASPFPVSGDTWLYGAGSDGMFLTEDGGETWTKVADQAMNQMYHAADDAYYVASLQDVIRSTDLHTWTKLPDSGRAIAVIGDGQRVFASESSAFMSDEPFHQASESDPMNWTALASPAGLYGANTFAYDPDHHILYAPSTSAGLWRMVTY